MAKLILYLLIVLSESFVSTSQDNKISKSLHLYRSWILKLRQATH